MLIGLWLTSAGEAVSQAKGDARREFETPIAGFFSSTMNPSGSAMFGIVPPVSRCGERPPAMGTSDARIPYRNTDAARPSAQAARFSGLRAT
jgi:hypothetical protein